MTFKKLKQCEDLVEFKPEWEDHLDSINKSISERDSNIKSLERKILLVNVATALFIVGVVVFTLLVVNGA